MPCPANILGSLLTIGANLRAPPLHFAHLFPQRSRCHSERSVPRFWFCAKRRDTQSRNLSSFCSSYAPTNDSSRWASAVVGAQHRGPQRAASARWGGSMPCPANILGYHCAIHPAREGANSNPACPSNRRHSACPDEGKGRSLSLLVLREAPSTAQVHPQQVVCFSTFPLPPCSFANTHPPISTPSSYLPVQKSTETHPCKTSPS